ncbi:response regulator [Sabulicella glaciei]|uniref:histidine kinase n=1 Tax=Sabulicella glaciei TaxID=2984948 RepID=A0ABT3NPD9_9PROT|nr:response regulator [Roseococcus sp. MDT2-1-1]MCW8084017.1 response regulator [Roseococcus sp. MDT2-1-1]
MPTAVAARRPSPLQPVLAALLILIAAACGAASYLTAARDRAEVAAGNALVFGLETTLSALKDVETGQRGYLLVGEDEYLVPFREGLRDIETRLGGLRALRDAAREPDEGQLETLIRQRVAIATRLVELKRSGIEDPLRTLGGIGEGKVLMDEIRTEVADQQERSRRRVTAIEARGARRATWLMAATLAATLGGALLLGLYAMGRRRAERAANALLDSVITNAPMGLAFLDTQMRASGANQAMEALGQSALGAKVGGGHPLPVPLREALEPKLREIMRGRARTAEVDLDLPPLAPGQAASHLRATLFRLRSDRSSGAGLVLEDVSLRKRAEARLRRSEARFRTLAEAMAQLAWTADADGAITWSNGRWREFTGLTDTKALGWDWLDLLDPEERDPVEGRLREGFASGEAWEESFALRRHDGQLRYFLTRAVPLPDEDGTPAAWFGTCTDVTELQEAQEAATAAQEAAEEANRAKSTFIANMSHELRTPLSAVIGYSEMLEEEAEELEGGEALVSDLRKIGTNARHLLSLINDVLDLSKIEAGKMEVAPEDIDVTRLVEEVTATVSALLRKNGNELEVRMDPDLGPMHSDPVKIRQSLINLLSNAGKFTQDGRVTLTVEETGAESGAREVVFRVADTGIGMTEEQLARLFRRFTQADSSTTRRFGGTGLGLSITKAFCEALGGSIDVASRVGEGTTFTIRLPADLSRPAEREAEPQAVEHVGAGLVLVVDDDPASRDLLARFVAREGFAARCARDGEEGLAMARSLRPTAIIADVMMPRMDGWAMLSALKNDPETAEIPVVMASILPERALAVSLGAADFLPKPVSWLRLKSVLDGWRTPGLALVVENDPDARAELRARLGEAGWASEEASGKEDALRRLADVPEIGLVLVALPGPGGDGLALVEELRRRGQSPQVIALTGGEVATEELEALKGQVRRILPADEEPPESLLAELRRLHPRPSNAAPGPALVTASKEVNQ